MITTTRPYEPQPASGWLEVRIEGRRALAYIEPTDSDSVIAEKALLALERLDRLAERPLVELGVVDLGGEGGES